MRVFLTQDFRKLGLQFTAPRSGDAGYDLFSIEAYTFRPGEQAVIRTGIHCEIPPHYVGLIKDRSSVAQKGLHIIAGVIDSSYRGEIKIVLVNLNPRNYQVDVGQKLAQLVVVPCYTDDVELVNDIEDLSVTLRGLQGFGSTNQKGD